ncbi:unnamed protein product [Caretta caretta]
MEEGLNGQGAQLTRQWPALTHPSTKDDRFRKGPVELDQTLCRDIEYLDKAHEPGPEAENPPSSQEITWFTLTNAFSWFRDRRGVEVGPTIHLLKEVDVVIEGLELVELLPAHSAGASPGSRPSTPAAL